MGNFLSNKKQAYFSDMVSCRFAETKQYPTSLLEQNAVGIKKELLALLVSELSRRIPEKNGLLHCMQRCQNYWHLYRGSMIDYTFNDSQEEVLFFKNLKPMFTSEVIFYSWAVKAVSNCPKGKNRALESYDCESRRLSDFFEANREFYIYYISGDSRYDLDYFTGGAQSIRCEFDEIPIESNLSLSSSHDLLVAYILAAKRYSQFLKQKFAKFR